MTKSSVLLINEPQIAVLPSLAVAIGLNEAIVLQQVHYWLVTASRAKNNDDSFIDDRWWVYNSYEQWQDSFPFWSISTIKRIFARLEEKGYLLSMQPQKQDFDMTKWYSIDYDKLNELIAHRVNLSQSMGSKWYDVNKKAETTLTEIKDSRAAKNAEAEANGKKTKASNQSQVVVKQTQKDVESDYAKLSHLEEVFAKERGITSPDWSTSAKERQKRWRNPIKLLLQQCNGDADLLERVIVKAVRDQMADGLSFSAPDGIYKKAQSMIIDELSSNHGQVVENEAGGYHL